MSEMTDPTAGEHPADYDAVVTAPPVIDHWHYWTDDDALIGCGYAERGEPCPAPHKVYASIVPPAVPATPDAAGEREAAAAVIDAIEDTFLAHLPSKALSYCAQEDVNAGLDAMRERFGLEERR